MAIETPKTQGTHPCARRLPMPSSEVGGQFHHRFELAALVRGDDFSRTGRVQGIQEKYDQNGRFGLRVFLIGSIPNIPSHFLEEKRSLLFELVLKVLHVVSGWVASQFFFSTTAAGTFALYTAVCVLAAFFLAIYVPETSGKSLSQVIHGGFQGV